MLLSHQLKSLFINKNVEDVIFCPVHALWMYFKLREPKEGAIFSFMDGTPISRSFFVQQLNLWL